jgi:hypothetical protein
VNGPAADVPWRIVWLVAKGEGVNETRKSAGPAACTRTFCGAAGVAAPDGVADTASELTLSPAVLTSDST